MEAKDEIEDNNIARASVFFIAYRLVNFAGK
jgi:hypothetical protein